MLLQDEQYIIKWLSQYGALSRSDNNFSHTPSEETLYSLALGKK